MTIEKPPASLAPENRRRFVRSRTIKHAKLVFGESNSVIDCLVLDESEGGVRAEIAMPMRLPDNMILRFADGAMADVSRRWTRGREMGFQFTKASKLSEDAALRLISVLETFKTVGFKAAATTLRENRFFGDPELRRVTEEAEAALGRFWQALSRHNSMKA